MTTLAIIGTAGRKDDAARLTLKVWNAMKRTVYEFVKGKNIRVISGGAAGADALAVGLYNADLVPELTLALPCEFDWQKGEFADNGERHWQTNPGGTCNYYHRAFSKVIGQNSLEQLKTAIHKGAVVEREDGFMARNSIVAGADTVIAFTFGNGAVIKDGGTADTCRKYLARGGSALWHVDLNTMKLHEGRVS